LVKEQEGNWTLIATVIGTSLVVLASKAITVFTKSTSDNKILDLVLKALNITSLNVLKDKNADAK
jgi:hypothetical protein